ncbi:MAG: dihydrodipicolinate synthase family protein [Desulfovibrionaceae bacterium]|nr:dihydrodipicolinate synthase family protein [Desulfovibrionaceae bacterium]
MQFKGIIPPAATIFDDDGSFNRKGMANLIDADIKGGVDGLFFLGSAGECMHMTTALRSEVAESPWPTPQGAYRRWWAPSDAARRTSSPTPRRRNVSARTDSCSSTPTTRA